MATATDQAGTFAEQAISSSEATLHQTIALQDAVAKLFTAMVTGAAWPAGWQTRMQAMAGQVAEANQRNVDEAHDYVNRGARSKRELTENILTPGGANPLEFWNTVVSTHWANIEAVWRTSARLFDSWVELAWLAGPQGDKRTRRGAV